MMLFEARIINTAIGIGVALLALALDRTLHQLRWNRVTAGD
jgi:hypothetical protein